MDACFNGLLTSRALEVNRNELIACSVPFSTVLSRQYERTFILFRTHNKKIESEVKIKIDNTEIVRETSTKFLGVIINKSLTWNDHISIVKQNVSKSIGIIKYVRKFTS